MVRVDLGLRTISRVLGTKACAENRDGDEVCLYTNAREDGRVYVKVTVNGRKVAYAAFSSRDIIAMLVPAVFTQVAASEDIRMLWDAVKKARRKRIEDEEVEEGNESRARKRRRRVEEEGEEAREEEEEEEELELL